MIQSQDGTFSSVTAFGVTKFATAAAAEHDETVFAAWAEARAGRPLTAIERVHGIHRDVRPDRERFAAQERRRELFTPPVVDDRLPAERVADDAEARAETARREAMPLVERQALEAREAAVAARKAADLKAERERIRATTAFSETREAINNLRVELAFDRNADFALLEETQLQLDLLDKTLDVAAGREALKLLRKAARERTENFLSQQKHVDVARDRLERTYRDVDQPFDVQFETDRGGREMVWMTDPETGKKLGVSRESYESSKPAWLLRQIRECGI